MSALIQLAQMKIQLALVQKQLAFWTQLAYNFRHCFSLCNDCMVYSIPIIFEAEIQQILEHAQIMKFGAVLAHKSL